MPTPQERYPGRPAAWYTGYRRGYVAMQLEIQGVSSLPDLPDTILDAINSGLSDPDIPDSAALTRLDRAMRLYAPDEDLDRLSTCAQGHYWLGYYRARPDARHDAGISDDWWLGHESIP